MPGPEWGRCGRLGHHQHKCPVMELGQVVEVAVASASSPGPDGTYQIPVKVQGGIHQALLDSGNSQTLIHQSLVRPEDASWMRVWCIHGDVHDYPLVTLENRHQGKMHNVRYA